MTKFERHNQIKIARRWALTALLLGLAISFGAYTFDEIYVRNHCEFIETRLVHQPWGAGMHDIYDCHGI